ncbi:MAG: hypothetical protein K9N07_11800 [Candidatus Cloacimonetes bacterium]|nr:hypothetical protein [Candidatus Cloacimonadota bacterium]
MKDRKLALIFISLMIVDIFFYFVSQFHSLFGSFNNIIIFSVYGFALFGLVIASRRKSLITMYYFGLFLVSGLLFIYFMMNPTDFIKYFYILSVLIALVLAIIDLRMGSRKIERDLRARIQVLKDRHEIELKNQKANEAYNKNEKLESKTAALEKEISESKSKINSYRSEIKSYKTEINSYKKEIDTLKKQLEKTSKIEVTQTQRRRISKLLSEKTELEKTLSKKEQEIEKQAELKQKYSKSLRNIRKSRKAEEELLVVAQDGKSVHRPKCIAVRNIPKDNRKLIANWKTAQKDGYKGCGLCRPHIIPKVITKGNRKFRYVASKGSDKVHKLSCVLVKNIKEKDLFSTYKQALKKGYTACRVCISEEKR